MVLFVIINSQCSQPLYSIVLTPTCCFSSIWCIISSLYDISSIQNIRYFWWGQDIWYFVYIQLFVGDIFCSVLMTLLIFCWCWVGYCIRFHEELTDVCCCVSDAEEIVLWSSLPSIKEKDFMYSEKTHIILCMEKIGNKLRVLSQSSVTSLKKNKT